MSYNPSNNWSIVVVNKNENYYAEISSPAGFRHLNYLILWLKERFEKNQIIRGNFDIWLIHSNKKLKISDLTSLSIESIHSIWGDSYKFNGNDFHHPTVTIEENNQKRYSSLPSGGLPNFDGIIEPFPVGYEPKNVDEFLFGMRKKYRTHSKYMTEVFDRAFILRPEIQDEERNNDFFEILEFDEDA